MLLSQIHPFREKIISGELKNKQKNCPLLLNNNKDVFCRAKKSSFSETFQESRNIVKLK